MNFILKKSKNCYFPFLFFNFIPILLYFTYQHLNAKTMIYLYQNNYFTEIELLTYDAFDENKKYYIRNFKYGRFLSPHELNQLLPPEFFYKIRHSKPMDAALSAFLFLNSGEEFILKRDSSIYYWNDQNTRWTKITLWSLSILSYFNTLQKAKQLKESDNMLFQNSKEKEKRFNFARNLFYLIFTTTAGFEFYISYRAYQLFGYDSLGNPLNITERKKIDSSILFPNQISLYYKKTF